MINLLKSLGIAFAALLCVATNASAQSGFPVIARAKLRITLVRSACFGACPDYKVTIDGDGNVMFASRGGDLKGAAMVHRAFSDRDGILVSGRFIDKIEPGRVDALIAKFREANFFALNDSYQAMVTDNPTYIVTIETGNGTFGRHGPTSLAGGTSGIVPNCVLSASGIGKPDAPIAASITRPPTVAVMRTCEVLRPRASSSTVHSMRSPTMALPTNCTVAHSACRRVSASRSAVVSAIPVPP